MSTRRKIQLLLWAYFWMLIFEGAFRKWLLPGLSDLFLVARDPICIAALVIGGAAVGRSGWAKVFIWCGVLGFILALTVGHGSIITAAYGLRIYLLHFPLIFLFPAVFDRADVWKFAKASLLVAIPMTVLTGFQHYLPPTHWLNIGPGGIDSAAFSGALGRFRPPGTFSFITGPSMFFPLCAALLGALFFGGFRPMPKWIWVSFVALVMALPFSISRSLGFSYLLVGGAMLAGGALSPRLVARVILATAVVGTIAFGVSQTETFRNPMRAFSSRWEGANKAEGGEEGMTGALRARTAGWIGDDVQRAFESAPILGVGLGSGTSVGANFISGKRGLNFGEGEWGIILFELGFILGFVVILVRVSLGIYLLAGAFRLARRGDGIALPLAALSFVWLTIGVGGQPTSLGFMVFSSGLCLVMLRDPSGAERVSPAAVGKVATRSMNQPAKNVARLR